MHTDADEDGDNVEPSAAHAQLCLRALTDEAVLGRMEEEKRKYLMKGIFRAPEDVYLAYVMNTSHLEAVRAGTTFDRTQAFEGAMEMWEELTDDKRHAWERRMKKARKGRMDMMINYALDDSIKAVPMTSSNIDEQHHDTNGIINASAAQKNDGVSAAINKKASGTMTKDVAQDSVEVKMEEQDDESGVPRPTFQSAVTYHPSRSPHPQSSGPGARPPIGPSAGAGGFGNRENGHPLPPRPAQSGGVNRGRQGGYRARGGRYRWACCLSSSVRTVFSGR